MLETKREKRNRRQREWVAKNRERINSQRRLKYHQTKNLKSTEQKVKESEYRHEWYSKNKVRIIEKKSTKYFSNRQLECRRNLDYRSKNIEQYKNKIAIWQKENEIHHKLISNTFYHINRSIRGITNNSQVLSRYLGYTSDELRRWAKVNLPESISLSEYGKTHRLRLIRSAISYNFESREDDSFRECFSFSNMRFTERVFPNGDRTVNDDNSRGSTLFNNPEAKVARIKHSLNKKYQELTDSSDTIQLLDFIEDVAESVLMDYNYEFYLYDNRVSINFDISEYGEVNANDLSNVVYQTLKQVAKKIYSQLGSMKSKVRYEVGYIDLTNQSINLTIEIIDNSTVEIEPYDEDEYIKSLELNFTA